MALKIVLEVGLDLPVRKIRCSDERNGPGPISHLANLDAGGDRTAGVTVLSVEPPGSMARSPAICVSM